jgi:hypothetical protein
MVNFKEKTKPPSMYNEYKKNWAKKNRAKKRDQGLTRQYIGGHWVWAKRKCPSSIPKN